MTEEWLKRQTQKMIVEFNRYIWGSDNDTHKKTMYVSFNEQVMRFYTTSEYTCRYSLLLLLLL